MQQRRCSGKWHANNKLSRSAEHRHRLLVRRVCETQQGKGVACALLDRIEEQNRSKPTEKRRALKLRSALFRSGSRTGSRTCCRVRCCRGCGVVIVVCRGCGGGRRRHIVEQPCNVAEQLRNVMGLGTVQQEKVNSVPTVFPAEIDLAPVDLTQRIKHRRLNLTSRRSVSARKLLNRSSLNC